MASRKTLKPVNIPQREMMELELLLPLLESRAGSRWQVTTSGDADAVLVDADDCSTEVLAGWDATNTHATLITIGVHKPGESNLHLKRPLRIEALAEILHRVPATGTPKSSGPEKATTKAYRILRWPPREVLQIDWRYARICGALSSGPQTPESLAERTAVDPDGLRNLLESLETRGMVEVTTTSIPVKASNPRNRPSIFNRLRARLGLR